MFDLTKQWQEGIQFYLSKQIIRLLTKNFDDKQRESKKGFFLYKGRQIHSQKCFHIPLFFLSDISKQRLICVKPIIFKPISTEWFEGKHCYHEGVSVSTGRIGGKRSDLILCTGDRGMVWSSTQKWKPRAMAYEITNNVNLSSHAYFIMPNCIYIHVYTCLFRIFN